MDMHLIHAMALMDTAPALEVDPKVGSSWALLDQMGTQDYPQSPNQIYHTERTPTPTVNS